MGQTRTSGASLMLKAMGTLLMLMETCAWKITQVRILDPWRPMTILEMEAQSQMKEIKESPKKRIRNKVPSCTERKFGDVTAYLNLRKYCTVIT